MKKTCGYKSLDGTIYESLYDCVKADDLHRAREIRGNIGILRRNIQDVIRQKDVIMENIMRYPAQSEKERQKEVNMYKLLKEINSDTLTNMISDMILVSMDDLKKIEKASQRRHRKLNQTRTHIFNYLKSALWH